MLTCRSALVRTIGHLTTIKNRLFYFVCVKCMYCKNKIIKKYISKKSMQCVIVLKKKVIPLLSNDLFFFVEEDVEVLSLCVFIFDKLKK